LNLGIFSRQLKQVEQTTQLKQYATLYPQEKKNTMQLAKHQTKLLDKINFKRMLPEAT
jgi:hypothetical protein